MKRLNFILLLLVSFSAFAGQPPVWVITHMANSADAVEWGASVGANGVEADLHFDKQGNPTFFQHSTNITEPCDCTCPDPYKNRPICEHLGESPCFSKIANKDFFAAVVAQSRIGLVVIDSKVDSKVSELAGKNLISTLESELFDKGYKGMVIISAPKVRRYLNDVATAAVASKNANRMYFSFDGEGHQTETVLKALVDLPPLTPKPYSSNIVYGTGLTTCLPEQYWKAILLSEVNRRASVIGFNYIWTIDKPDSGSEYLEKGAHGIMTNNPGEMVKRVQSSGYTMAESGKPASFFPTATSKTVLTTVPECDCSHRSGGCTITTAAPAGWACKCAVTLPLTCSGSVVLCQDPDSEACRKPSMDKASCEQGGGNCGGYPK